MADPLVKTWGPLELRKTLIAEGDPTLEATDKEQAFKLSTIDCFPPPVAITEYAHPASILPSVKRNSLQTSDAANLANISELFAGWPIGTRGVQTYIEAKLELKAFVISYAAKAYKNLRQLNPCYTSDIYLRVKFKIYEIKVSAKQELSLGNDVYASGDEILTYRIREGAHYRFEVHARWNKQCCEVEPRGLELEPTPYYAGIDKKSIEEVITTGQKIKSLEPKPVPVAPKDEVELFEHGLKFEYKDQWGIRPGWGWYLDDD